MNNDMQWIEDLVTLAFPKGEARQRVLLDLIKRFGRVDPDDPALLRFKLAAVELKARRRVRLLGLWTNILVPLIGSWIGSYIYWRYLRGIKF